MKLASLYRGGLGDQIERYVQPGGDAGYWKVLKEAGHEIHAIVVGVNPDMAALIETNPWLDKVHFRNYAEDFRGIWREVMEENGLTRLRDGVDTSTLSWEAPVIHLTDDEEWMVQSLPSNYVVIHPFAGEAYRNWSGWVNVSNLVDWICEAGWRVVILGGSSIRHEYGAGNQLSESFEYSHPDVANLVGKASIRVQMHMALNASAFIGTNSCFASAAHMKGIRSLLITSPKLRLYFDYSSFSIWENLRKNRTQYLFFNELDEIDLREFVQHFLEGEQSWDYRGLSKEFDVW